MSGKGRRQLRGSDRVSPLSGYGKKCKDCRKYSRNTFYCAKNGKVLAQDLDACESFAPRHLNREHRTRKLYKR